MGSGAQKRKWKLTPPGPHSCGVANTQFSYEANGRAEVFCFFLGGGGVNPD